MSTYSKQVNNCLLSLQQIMSNAQFDALVNLTFSHLKEIARMYLADKSYVEDVISDAYIRVLNHIQSFNPSQNGYNWMCRIVQNVAYDYNLKAKQSAIAEQKFALEHGGVVCATDASDIDFFAIIDKLDGIDKEIAYKRFYWDESVQSIAQSLNISKSAVSKRIKNISKKTKKITKKR